MWLQGLLILTANVKRLASYKNRPCVLVSPTSFSHQVVAVFLLYQTRIVFSWDNYSINKE